MWCTEPDLPEASGERKSGDRRHSVTSTKLPFPFVHITINLRVLADVPWSGFCS